MPRRIIPYESEFTSGASSRPTFLEAEMQKILQGSLFPDDVVFSFICAFCF